MKRPESVCDNAVTNRIVYAHAVAKHGSGQLFWIVTFARVCHFHHASLHRTPFCFFHKMSNEIRVRALRVFYKSFWGPEVTYVMFHLLGTLGGRFSLAQRELAFAWRNDQSGAEGWNRHKLCRTWQEAARTLQESGLNVNFGAIFCAPPSNREWGKGESRDWERFRVIKALPLAAGAEPRVSTLMADAVGTPRGELVFDIDLDQRVYDRTGICDCGTQRKACAKCWFAFMDPAQMIMTALMEHLGVDRWFAYFTGRRGLAYCVCSEQVIQMTNLQRAQFVNSLAEPPTRHSDWGRYVFDLVRPHFQGHPVLRTRVGPDGDLYAAVMAQLWPKIDTAVGEDASHLHSVPCTLHPDTAVYRMPLDRTRLFDFENERWTLDDDKKLTRGVVKLHAVLLAHYITGRPANECWSDIQKAKMNAL